MAEFRSTEELEHASVQRETENQEKQAYTPRPKWQLAAAWVLAALLLACMLVPSVRFTEDNDTVLLAKVIYAQCKNEDYSAKLALGREVMRRVDDPWYPATLGEVLREQQQFPAGTRYDSESLRAAHAVIAE